MMTYKELEKLVDENSIAHVLELLAAICDEKAKHIRITGGRGGDALCWERADKALRETKTYGC